VNLAHQFFNEVFTILYHTLSAFFLARSRRVGSTVGIPSRSDEEAEPPSSLPPSPTAPRAVTGAREIHEGIHALAPDPFRRSGSITPTTQGEAESIFYSPEALTALNIKLRKLMQDQAAKLSAEEENLLALHKLSRKLLEVNYIKRNDFMFTINYQCNINPARATSPAPLGLPIGPQVMRFGINPEALDGAVTDKSYTIPANQLHFVEKEVLKLALDRLSRTLLPTTFEEGVFAHNVVVVDIFAREKAGLKKITGTDSPEIHAIVLWKPVEEYIVIIDLNKREFSEHIIGKLNSKCEGTITFTAPPIPGSVIYTTQGKETGYSNYTDPHPKARDCIDVAVKLAFEINEQEQAMRSITRRGISLEDPETITGHVIERISNRKRLNPAVTELDETVLREIQSSDKNTRDRAITYLLENTPMIKKIKKNLDSPSLQSIQEKVEEEKASALAREVARAARARGRTGRE
jgi:hypothetical protein